MTLVLNLFRFCPISALLPCGFVEPPFAMSMAAVWGHLLKVTTLAVEHARYVHQKATKLYQEFLCFTLFPLNAQGVESRSW